MPHHIAIKTSHWSVVSLRQINQVASIAPFSELEENRAVSTAELKDFIDKRTPEERKWMTSYLLDDLASIPELRQTAEDLAELTRRRADLTIGRERIDQATAEAHWDKLEQTAT